MYMHIEMDIYECIRMHGCIYAYMYIYIYTERGREREFVLLFWLQKRKHIIERLHTQHANAKYSFI